MPRSVTHTYAQEGLNGFSIDLTAPGSRSITIAPPAGQGITVESPGVTLTPVPIHALALASFSGTIATFTDPSTTVQVSNFRLFGRIRGLNSIGNLFV
jgi:hypothetical protein